jgi:hypothetical protein
MYSYYFIGRRALAASVLVLFDNYPFFQMATLVSFSVIQLSYIIGSKPLKYGNNVEFANELSVYICTLLILNFRNTNAPLELSDTTGWVVIVIVSFTAFANISLVMIGSVKETVVSYRKKKLYKTLQKIIQKKKANRTMLIYSYPEQTEYLKKQGEEEEAIRKVRKWNEHKRWLRANKIDFSTFPEETKSKKLIERHNLFRKANIQRLFTSVDILAKEQTFEQIENYRHLKTAQSHSNKDYIREQISRGIGVEERGGETR